MARRGRGLSIGVAFLLAASALAAIWIGGVHPGVDRGIRVHGTIADDAAVTPGLARSIERKPRNGAREIDVDKRNADGYVEQLEQILDAEPATGGLSGRR